jgi:hypothetical protein
VNANEQTVIQSLADALTSASLLAAHIQRDVVETPEILQLIKELVRATTALRRLAPSGQEVQAVLPHLGVR